MLTVLALAGAIAAALLAWRFGESQLDLFVFSFAAGGLLLAVLQSTLWASRRPHALIQIVTGNSPGLTGLMGTMLLVRGAFFEGPEEARTAALICGALLVFAPVLLIAVFGILAGKAGS